jgi:hypothetical protein
MLDLVTIRAKYDALLNLSFHRVYGKAAANHVSDIEIFCVSFVMMKFQCTEVCKSTAFAGETFFVIVKPLAEFGSSQIRYRSLTFLTLPPTIDFTGDYFADFECFVRLFFLAGLTGLQFLGEKKSGRMDSNHRPLGPEPSALPG